MEALEATLAEERRTARAKEARHKLIVERLRCQIVKLQVCLAAQQAYKDDCLTATPALNDMQHIGVKSQGMIETWFVMFLIGEEWGAARRGALA